MPQNASGRMANVSPSLPGGVQGGDVLVPPRLVAVLGRAEPFVVTSAALERRAGLVNAFQACC